MRWVILEETNPERNIVMLYPMDIKRNRLPACAWLRFKSFSMVKSKGEKISRERKLKNTIPAKKKMGVMLEKKLFCSGFAKIFLLFRYKKLKINTGIIWNQYVAFSCQRHVKNFRFYHALNIKFHTLPDIFAIKLTYFSRPHRAFCPYTLLVDDQGFRTIPTRLISHLYPHHLYMSIVYTSIHL